MGWSVEWITDMKDHYGLVNEFHLFDLKQGAIINVFILVHS